MEAGWSRQSDYSCKTQRPSRVPLRCENGRGGVSLGPVRPPAMATELAPVVADAPPPRTVLISGCGIVGLTAAIALRALPSPPTVIIHERRCKEEALSGPGGIMIQPNGLAGLSALADGSGDALIAAISAVARPLGRGAFQSAAGKDLYIAEPAGVTLGARKADLGVCVSRTALMGALAEAAGVGASGGVKVVWQSAVRRFDVVHGEGGVAKVDVQLETAGLKWCKGWTC